MLLILIIMLTNLNSFNTYLITSARVEVSSTSYGRPIHKFYWVLDDGETIIERVNLTDEHEKPLPPPTILKDHIVTMFSAPTTEIDILDVVLRCGPLKYVGAFKISVARILLSIIRRDNFFSLYRKTLEKLKERNSKLK